MAEKSVRVDRSLVAVPKARPYRRRYRHMARDVSTGLFYTAGAGAIVALLANIDDIRNSKESKDHWWLVPVALIALGYLLRKQHSPHAGAVIAAGGAIFALAYSAKQRAEKQQTQTPAPAPPKNDTAGPFTALPEAHRGVWVQMPDGRIIPLPLITRRAANATQYA
jgi:drug/metabolite transporter superfamily protein YnfA